MYSGFPVSVVERDLRLLSTKSFSASVVLIRFFPRLFFRSRVLFFFVEIAIFRYGAPRSRFATQSSAVFVRNAKKDVG